MKTQEGKNWFVTELDAYTDEFLQTIILDLLTQIIKLELKLKNK